MATYLSPFLSSLLCFEARNLLISLLSLSAIGAFATAVTAATSSVVIPAVVACRVVLGTILGTLGNAIL